MPATGQDFIMWAGDTFALSIQVLAHGGVPYDLTAAQQVKWSLSRLASDVTPLISKSTAGGITVTDAPSGKFTVSIAATDTAALSGDYYHEAEIIDAAGDVLTVVVGIATIQLSLVR